MEGPKPDAERGFAATREVHTKKRFPQVEDACPMARILAELLLAKWIFEGDCRDCGRSLEDVTRALAEFALRLGCHFTTQGCLRR